MPKGRHDNKLPIGIPQNYKLSWWAVEIRPVEMRVLHWKWLVTQQQKGKPSTGVPTTNLPDNCLAGTPVYQPSKRCTLSAHNSHSTQWLTQHTVNSSSLQRKWDACWASWATHNSPKKGRHHKTSIGGSPKLPPYDNLVGNPAPAFPGSSCLAVMLAWLMGLAGPEKSYLQPPGKLCRKDQPQIRIGLFTVPCLPCAPSGCSQNYILFIFLFCN